MNGKRPKRKFFMTQRMFKVRKGAVPGLLKNHKELMKRKAEFVKDLYSKGGPQALTDFYVNVRSRATALLARGFIDLKKKHGIKIEGNESWTALKTLEIPKLSKSQAIAAFEFVREINKRIDAKSDFLLDADMFIAKRLHETKNPEEKKQLDEAIKSFHEHPPLAHNFLGILSTKLREIIMKS